MSFQKTVKAMVAIRRMQSSFKLSGGLSKDASLSPSSPPHEPTIDEVDTDRAMCTQSSQDSDKTVTPTLSPLLITCGPTTTDITSSTPTSKDIFEYPTPVDSKFTDAGTGHEEEITPQVSPNASDDNNGLSDAVDSGYEGRKCTAEMEPEEVKSESSLPIFLQQLPEELHVIESDCAKFVVQIQSDTDLDVSWFRDSEPVSMSDRVEVEEEDGTHSLTIRDVKLNDDAEYECRAKNECGDKSSFVELYIVRSA